MTNASDGSGAVLLFLLLLQLGLFVGLIAGGIYALACLNRTATATERLAELYEAFLQGQNGSAMAPTFIPSPPMQMAPTVETPVLTATPQNLSTAPVSNSPTI